MEVAIGPDQDMITSVSSYIQIFLQQFHDDSYENDAGNIAGDGGLKRKIRIRFRLWKDHRRKRGINVLGVTWKATWRYALFRAYNSWWRLHWSCRWRWKWTRGSARDVNCWRCRRWPHFRSRPARTATAPLSRWEVRSPFFHSIIWLILCETKGKHLSNTHDLFTIGRQNKCTHSHGRRTDSFFWKMCDGYVQRRWEKLKRKSRDPKWTV